jgi:hypothetical protein
VGPGRPDPGAVGFVVPCHRPDEVVRALRASHAPVVCTLTSPSDRSSSAAMTSSWQSFERHPLVGEGPGALTGQNRGVPYRAHLTPLNIAATMGAPALAAFALLAGLALDGLAQDIDHFRHLWVMIGLADADRAAGEGGRRGARMERRHRRTVP